MSLERTDLFMAREHWDPTERDNWAALIKKVGMREIGSILWDMGFTTAVALSQLDQRTRQRLIANIWEAKRRGRKRKLNK